jgi:pimeloyl-ACP methyl ester carboxylesterase
LSSRVFQRQKDAAMKFQLPFFLTAMAVLCCFCLLPGCGDDDDDSSDPQQTDDDSGDDDTDDDAQDDDSDDDDAGNDDIDDDIVDKPTTPLCDLTPGDIHLPFPNMYMSEPDARRATGAKLTLDKELPEAVETALAAAVDTDIAEAIPELDGFSILSPIMIPFSGALEMTAWIDGLPGDPRQPEEGFVRLVDVTEEAAQLLWHKVSFIEGRNVLVVHPTRPLPPAARILVCIVGPLNDASGNAVERAPLFESVINDEQGLPDDPMIDDLREARDMILAGSVGVSIDDALLAFTYRTGSGQALIHAMRRAVEEVDTATPIEPQDLVWEGDRTVRGTYISPDFRVDGYIPMTDPDELTIQEMASLSFVLRLPEIIEGALYPVIFLHGLGGSRNWAPSIEGAAVFAIDAVLHGGRDEDFESDAAYPFLDFKRLRLLRDNIRQTAADHVALARMIERIVADPVAYGLPQMMENTLATLGHSLGCINGMAFSSIDPAVDHAVGVGGGGMFSYFQKRSPYGLFMPAAIRGLPPFEALIFQHFMQAGLDPADPASLAPGLIREPPDGRGPRNVLVLDVIGDRSVPNLSTEALAWAAGLGIAETAPSNVFGLQSFPLPVTGNLDEVTGLLYEYQMDYLPPTDRHGELFSSHLQWEQVKTFLQTAAQTGVATVIDPEATP